MADFQFGLGHGSVRYMCTKLLCIYHQDLPLRGILPRPTA